jgi:hypothetical protein
LRGGSVVGGGGFSGLGGSLRSISKGTDHVCGVRSDGGVECLSSYGILEAGWTGERVTHALTLGGDVCGLNGHGEVVCDSPFWAEPGTYTQLALGVSTACGLEPDGGLRCWYRGREWVPQVYVPEGMFSQLLPYDGGEGWDGYCALDAAGAATCWDALHAGPIEAPAGTYRSLGSYCGVRTDGTLTCQEPYANPPAGLFTSVATGAGACALDLLGRVQCWSRGRPDWAPPGAFTKLAVGSIACGLRPGGRVDCWDSTQYDPIFDSQTYVPRGAFTDIASGEGGSTCGIRTDGEVVCWGGFRTPEYE